MTEPQPILVARRYAELVDGVAARIAQLKVSHLDVDAAAGLAEGHTGKLQCGTKCYGEDSLNKHLKALGLCLIVAVDPQRQPQISDSRELAPRDASAVVAARLRTRQGRELLHEILCRNQKRGRNKIRAGIMRKRTKQQRRSQARRAAKARWSTPKVVELKGKAAVAARKAIEEKIG